AGAEVEASFFFSSRRRHTRSKHDWSSDVCSSDLEREPVQESARVLLGIEFAVRARASGHRQRCQLVTRPDVLRDGAVRENPAVRSEERRVGKERRAGKSSKSSEKTVKS